MKLHELLENLPPVRSVPGARQEIRKRLSDSGKALVVIDDDPTGTQTVHDVPVYMDWSVEQLRQALDSGMPIFYISTNSRGLNAEDAQQLSLELGRNLAEAARLEGRGVILASRSDSTLRGHFPLEVTSLMSGLGQRVDGVLIAPAFFEAGRYTIGDVHWVQQGDDLISAEQTEFARDPVFGYKHGNLRHWLEEKTGGAVKADSVRSISLETIRRGGPEAVAEVLLQASGAEPIVMNAAAYEDLEIAVLGLAEAEALGKVFACRCAASFVKVRGGLEDRALLTRADLKVRPGPGLVMVGSYVGKTSHQLDALLGSGKVAGAELRVDRLLDNRGRDAEIRRVSAWADSRLAQGQSTAVYTSRAKCLVEGAGFLEVGSTIMSSLCRVLQRMTVQPSFLVAKGGITSIELARTALGVKQAEVLGQILEGVPVWRLGAESRWSGIPYIVFPGNVGGDEALEKVVSTLSGSPEIEPGAICNEVR